MAQLIRITSEALQATVRRLLPSQQGFGEDLQASNVIQPIIDLTPTAEGSQLPLLLANAINFTDATPFSLNSATTVLANTPGFYRVFGQFTMNARAGEATGVEFKLTDGLSNKSVWGSSCEANSNTPLITGIYDFVVFLDSGDSLSGVSEHSGSRLAGSVRQIADRYGEIKNPTGFTFE